MIVNGAYSLGNVHTSCICNLARPREKGGGAGEGAGETELEKAAVTICILLNDLIEESKLQEPSVFNAL